VAEIAPRWEAPAEESLIFLKHFGGRAFWDVLKKHLEEADPPVNRDDTGTLTETIPHLSTFALEFILDMIKFQPKEGTAGFSTKVKTTMKLFEQLANAFPVQSKIDDCHFFEGPTMIAWMIPNRFKPSSEPHFHVEVTDTMQQDEIPDFIWELSRNEDALGSRQGIFDAPVPRRRSRRKA
jgi:hypothetical protein